MIKNFRMRKYFACVLLPAFVLCVVALSAQAFVFIPGVAALAEFMGASSAMATAIDASLALHAVVLSIGFNTLNSTTPPTAGTPRPLEVMVNPKQPLPVPAGWTAPVAPAIQPVPPSTATSTSTSTYRLGTTGATGSTPALACAANHGTWNSFMQRCDSVPQADCTAAGITSCQLYNNLSIGLVTTYTCPAGYTVSGSTCTLTAPAQVKKPLDGRCLWISESPGQFPYPDPQNPACDAQIAANINLPGVTYVGDGFKVIRGTNKVTIERGDGSSTTYTVNTTTLASTVVESYPDVAAGQTRNFQTDLSAPAADGTVTVTGSAKGVTNGTGTTSSVAAGGVNGTSGFPGDYARSGEATNAANGLGTKLDALHGDLTGTTNTTDPTQPTISDMPGWSNTFTSLVSWQLPAHSSACPTPSLDLSGVLGPGKIFVMNSHCTLINNHFNTLQSAMTVVWSVLALFIVLRA